MTTENTPLYSALIESYVTLTQSAAEYIEQLGTAQYLPVKTSNAVQKALNDFETKKEKTRQTLTQADATEDTLSQFADALHNLTDAVETESNTHNVTPPSIQEPSINDDGTRVFSNLYSNTLQHISSIIAQEWTIQQNAMDKTFPNGDTPIDLIDTFTDEQNAIAGNFWQINTNIKKALKEENLDNVISLSPLFVEAILTYRDMLEKSAQKYLQEGGSLSAQPETTPALQAIASAPDSATEPATTMATKSRTHLRVIK